MSVNTLNKTTRELEPIAGVPSTKIQSLENQINNVDSEISELTSCKLGDFATVSDVTISSVTYHTYWEVAPTSSNQVYGVAIHPTNGRLCRIYNNKGTYSIQYYDLNTTTGTTYSAGSVPNNTTFATNGSVKNSYDALVSNKAEKLSLTGIHIASGTANDTGSTITSGTFFYYKNLLVKAKTDIAAEATLTLNTNYEEVTAGGLNALNSALATKMDSSVMGFTNMNQINFSRGGDVVYIEWVNQNIKYNVGFHPTNGIIFNRFDGSTWTNVWTIPKP